MSKNVKKAKSHSNTVSEFCKEPGTVVSSSYEELVVDWKDSNTYHVSGEHIGTCILLNNNIIGLKYFSDENLDKLLSVFTSAIEHEKEYRKHPEATKLIIPNDK